VNLARRLDRLERAIQGRQDDDFWVCRQIIYKPREWDVGKDEAIARMQADELDRLVASGEIREPDRERVSWIIWTVVYPPDRSDTPGQLCRVGGE
jgi:hypothetical protein